MFEGILTALITPFKKGEIDESALRDLVERQIAAGANGVVPCGSTGESATLSHEEHRRVIDVVIEAAAGRIPVVPGTGSNSTKEAIDLTSHAREAGADGALLLSPYYNKPTQEGIHDHYAAIAQATGFPLIVYNIPGRTASNIHPKTLARLAELPEVVGVKEACGDVDQIAHVIAHCPESFRVLSGDDALTLPVLALGGHGCISTTANLIPEQMVALYQAWREGDPQKALALHQQMLPLFDVLFSETNPIPVKAALALMGEVDEEIRLPLTPMTEPNKAQLSAVMKEAGIL
ncbi:MAG: 4-hydroxy-tetrahydrodipicolinate synthase [Deltaproteobacteria bacterium]|nr:4-hydroxy-tetrahydrodipicolinate synthase [Deltaproteobacteria bacterium]